MLTSNKPMMQYFEKLVTYYNNYKIMTNWLIVGVLGYLNKNNQTFENMKMEPKELATMVKYIDEGKISSKQAKDVFEHLMSSAKTVDEIIKELNIVQISDDTTLLAIINEVLTEFSSSVDDYFAGKDRAFGFMIGQIMKKTKGQANPAKVNQLLKQELEKLKK